MRSIVKVIVLVFLVTFLSGCDLEHISGTYYSDHGDGIRIEKDGKVFWSDISKTDEDFKFLCILSFDAENRETFLTFPSASPFIGTNFRFSEDLKSISVEWNRLDGKPVDYRGSTYFRK